MEMSFTNVLSKDYTKHIRANRQLISALRKSQSQISTTWIHTHMNFTQNEATDYEAKKSAVGAISVNKEIHCNNSKSRGMIMTTN